jgi:hypothetical protein
MAKQRKATKRIYKGEDGRWRLETTYTTGRVCAAILDSQEEAEQLLALSEKYYKRQVQVTNKSTGYVSVGRVTNTGLLHHNDGTISEMLYVRYEKRGGTYLVAAKDCELLTTLTEVPLK